MTDHSGLAAFGMPASGRLRTARTGERALGNRPHFGSGERAPKAQGNEPGAACVEGE